MFGGFFQWNKKPISDEEKLVKWQDCYKFDYFSVTGKNVWKLKSGHDESEYVEYFRKAWKDDPVPDDVATQNDLKDIQRQRLSAELYKKLQKDIERRGFEVFQRRRLFT